jgi:hypothetical protein
MQKAVWQTANRRSPDLRKHGAWSISIREPRSERHRIREILPKVSRAQPDGERKHDSHVEGRSVYRPDTGVTLVARTGVTFHRGLLAALLLALILFAPACAEMELLTDGSRGGPGPPPSGSLSVSFIDVGQGDGVLVQAGDESYLIDAGRPEEGPNVVDFLRSRGVESLDGIVVSNPRS